MTPVESRYLKPEVQGSGSDDAIFERNDVAYCCLLTLDAAGKLSNLSVANANLCWR